MALRIAIGQFPVERDVRHNGKFIMRQMKSASRKGAAIVQFPECALGGYAGFNFQGFRNYDWSLLQRCMREIMALARELKLWVILGSNHRLSGRRKPHNSLYLINDHGSIVDRYDKLFCMGAEGEHDLKHYTPGSRFVVFTLRGIQCGLLICHDWRYPEVYRKYKQYGVKIVFQSWYDGALSQSAFKRSGRSLGQVIRATVQGHAACNALWICGSNTSKPESCFGAFVAQPDGLMARMAKRNRPAVLIRDIDVDRPFDDPAEPWRARAVSGVLHSGKTVSDPRSEDRTCL